METTLKVNTRGLSISMRRKTLLVKREKREYRDNWKDESEITGKKDNFWEISYGKNWWPILKTIVAIMFM